MDLTTTCFSPMRLAIRSASSFLVRVAISVLTFG
jgi:hypothetical protein